MGPQILGIHPSMFRNKTTNQGKGNRVISILYFYDSIFLNCLGNIYSSEGKSSCILFYV